MYKNLLLISLITISSHAWADDTQNQELVKKTKKEAQAEIYTYEAKLWTNHAANGADNLVQEADILTSEMICYRLGIMSQHLESASVATSQFVATIVFDRSKSDFLKNNRDKIDILIKTPIMVFRTLNSGYCGRSPYVRNTINPFDKKALLENLSKLSVNAKKVLTTLEFLAPEKSSK